MPDEVTLTERLSALRTWGDNLPRSVLEPLIGYEPKMAFAERHGTWTLQVKWVDSGISKAAELGFTNAQSVPDTEAKSAVVSVRSSASSRQQFIVETLFERRRTMSRMKDDELEELLKAAVQRAKEYNELSLRHTYLFGGNAE